VIVELSGIMDSTSASVTLPSSLVPVRFVHTSMRSTGALRKYVNTRRSIAIC
jgi:hypothetical protein